MSKSYYVYIYRDPRQGKELEPIYVGKGTGDRAYFHINRDDRHYFTSKLKAIKSAGFDPLDYIEVIPQESEEAALEKEVELIAFYGRHDLNQGPLTNLTDGGDGFSGYVVSPELRKRMNDAIISALAARSSEDRTAQKVKQVTALQAYFSSPAAREETRIKSKAFYDSEEKRINHGLKVKAGKEAIDPEAKAKGDENRAKALRAALAKTPAEVREEWYNKSRAALSARTPEQEAERKRKLSEAHLKRTPEQRSESNRKRQETIAKQKAQLNELGQPSLTTSSM